MVVTTRFFQGYPWRFVFTDLQLVTTTWAVGLLSGRTVTSALGEPTVIESDIDPDDFRVNGLWTDDYPRVAQSNRLIFGFRRSGSTEASAYSPWEVAAAGILMAPEDEGDTDVPLTHVVAYDPRMYLDARPCMDADGALWPSFAAGGAQPFQFVQQPAGEIGLYFLKNTILNEGGVFIDAGPDWGGTAQWGGVIEDTAEIDYEVQTGTSVKQVWDELQSMGVVEFVLRPIYDTDRFITVDSVDYYFTHELSVYVQAGEERPSAPFAWGRLMNNCARISRSHDATPGNFFNKVLYFAGQGGLPIPADGPSVASGTINQATINDFLVYWSQQFFPTQHQNNDTEVASAVLMMAQQQLKLVKQGRRTVTINPITERAPVALDDYEVGDRVPVYISRKARQIAEGYQRVEAIPIQIQDNDSYEQVDALLTTPDWNEDPQS